jgi:streptogramin lyase
MGAPKAVRSGKRFGRGAWLAGGLSIVVVACSAAPAQPAATDSAPIATPRPLATATTSAATAGPAITPAPSSQSTAVPTAALTAPSTPAPATASPAPSASSAAIVPPVGTWTGTLGDASFSSPVQMTFSGCAVVGKACGADLYQDPGDPNGSLICGASLVYQGVVDGKLAFDEAFDFHPWICFSNGLRITPVDATTFTVEQFGDPGIVCCTGTFTQVSTEVVTEPDPALTTIDGLGREVTWLRLDGATTQYAAVAAGSVWFPITEAAAVERIDGSTGAVIARVANGGDPGAVAAQGGIPSDPHSVAALGDTVWVAQAAAKSVARIDPATNALAQSIEIGIVPYALALDAKTLWVTSFQDDAAVAIDLATGRVSKTITVEKPTGVTIGAGSAWVVEHRAGRVVRIDAKSHAVKRIDLGGGPNGNCGKCVENIVFSDGAAWTANNEGRSITRIDAATGKATEIALPLRAWTVSAGGGYIWASQFGDNPLDTAAWGVARIDPATNHVTTFAVPGVQSVLWSEGMLWLMVPAAPGFHGPKALGDGMLGLQLAP